MLSVIALSVFVGSSYHDVFLAAGRGAGTIYPSIAVFNNEHILQGPKNYLPELSLHFATGNYPVPTCD